MRLNEGDLVQHDGDRGLVQTIHDGQAVVWTRSGHLKIFKRSGEYLGTHQRRPLGQIEPQGRQGIRRPTESQAREQEAKEGNLGAAQAATKDRLPTIRKPVRAGEQAEQRRTGIKEFEEVRDSEGEMEMSYLRERVPVDQDVRSSGEGPHVLEGVQPMPEQNRDKALHIGGGGFERGRPVQRQDLTGRTFERLTVTKMGPTILQGKRRAKARTWMCSCVCKAKCSATTSQLLNGKKRSCGCLQREAKKLSGKKYGGWNKMPEGRSGVRPLHSIYKKRARTKEVDFDIDLGRFETITSSDCHYCGNKPSCLIGTYLYNGLDRIDNDGPYTDKNVVACCKNCNLAKRSMTKAEFIDMAIRIARIHGG
jgi:hypothetical protein